MLNSKDSRSVQERKNALWFFVALLVGGTLIWASKESFGSGPGIQQWIPAIVAGLIVIALMFYYVFNAEESPEEEGDNVYYLGLLFTLLSLIFALVEIFGLDDGVKTSDQVRRLLVNFGIALTSTVWGILGRIIVQNWQASPPSWLRRSPRSNGRHEGSISEDSGVDALIDAPSGLDPEMLSQLNREILSRTARDLTQGANALARFHITVRSHASDTDEYLTAHRRRLIEDSDSFKNGLETDTTTFIQDLRDMGTRFLNEIRQQHDSVSQLSMSLIEAVGDAQMNMVATSQEQLDTFSKTLQETNASLLDELRQSTSSIRSMSQSISRELLPALDHFGNKIEVFGESVQIVNESGLQIGDGWKDVAINTKSANLELDRFNAQITEARNALKLLLAPLKETSDKLEGSIRLEESARATLEISEKVRTIIDDSAAVVEQTKSSVEAIGQFKRSIDEANQASVINLESVNKLSVAVDRLIEILNKAPQETKRWWRLKRK